MASVNRIYRPETVALAKGGAAQERAIARIRAALKANDGRVPETAKALDCSARTLARWLAKDRALQALALKLRIAAGVPGRRS